MSKGKHLAEPQTCLRAGTNQITELKLNQPPGIYFVAVRTASQTYLMKVEVE